MPERTARRRRSHARSRSTLRVRIERGSITYTCTLSRGALDSLGSRLRGSASVARAIVVSDGHVAALYGARALRSLRRAGIGAELVSFPAGERFKTLATAARIYEHLAELEADRDTVLVALGGGVVGDLAGFVAGTYLRGLKLVHVPTTVLAQADSAIGGKTGVDLRHGKNLVGVFHQPALVLVDPDMLGTLPSRQVRAGLAEIVKVAMAVDAGLFRHLERHAEAILRLDPEATEWALARAIRAKARVVAADERDTGARMLLNYGHTAGHALEVLGGYRKWLHGEAVAHGMILAARLARSLGFLDAAAEDRQRALLRRFGLGRAFPRVSATKLLSYMRLDKKAKAGEPAFVLTTGIGVARVQRHLPREEVMRALTDLGAEP